MEIKEYLNKFTFLEKILGLIIIGIILIVVVYSVSVRHQQTQANFRKEVAEQQERMDATEAREEKEAKEKREKTLKEMTEQGNQMDREIFERKTLRELDDIKQRLGR